MSIQARVFRVSGTPGFIAPEAADGLRVESCDVFGLACSAWSCLLGVAPFGVAPAGADVCSAVLRLIERARAGELELPETLPKDCRAACSRSSGQGCARMLDNGRCSRARGGREGRDA
jgi:serine/threonine protein kinase